MSKLELIRDFVNERLAAAALEIFVLFEKTLIECQDEILRSREECAQPRMLNMILPETKLHQTDVQQLSLPEPPQIKEEQDLWSSQQEEQLSFPEPSQIEEEREMWTSQGEEQLSLPEPLRIEEDRHLWTGQAEEQLQTLKFGTTDFIFDSPGLMTHCDPEKSSQLPRRRQTPNAESTARRSLPANTAEGKFKAESDTDSYGGAPELVSYLQRPRSDYPTGDRLEKDSLSAGMLNLPVKSGRTVPKGPRPIPSAASSSGPILSTKTSSWTRPPVTSFRPEIEYVSSVQAERKTVEKPYQCEECGEAFSQNCDLNIHRRSHTGVKPYQCGKCDKSFSKTSTLNIHRRTHAGEKTFQCELCAKAFTQKIHLIVHKRVHTGERPYKCEECSRAFSHKCNLVVHKRIHTGEKPHRCGECHKAFADKRSLVNHRRTHTGDYYLYVV